MKDVAAINSQIQARLASEGLSETTAVEAAEWLDEAGVLADSASRPGRPLRDLLRKGLIVGAWQERNGHWFIGRQDG